MVPMVTSHNDVSDDAQPPSPPPQASTMCHRGSRLKTLSTLCIHITETPWSLKHIHRYSFWVLHFHMEPLDIMITVQHLLLAIFKFD